MPLQLSLCVTAAWQSLLPQCDVQPGGVCRGVIRVTGVALLMSVRNNGQRLREAATPVMPVGAEAITIEIAASTSISSALLITCSLAYDIGLITISKLVGLKSAVSSAEYVHAHFWMKCLVGHHCGIAIAGLHFPVLLPVAIHKYSARGRWFHICLAVQASQ